MSISRKQLKAQIAMKDKILQQHRAQVLEHQHYFHYHRVNHAILLIVAILLPSLWIGFKMKGDKWINKLAAQLSEVVTLAFMTYFRRLIIRLLK